ncbi:hypothetical protein PTI98_005334 [Pleurotus ostreatus]|nr:hypothetical protein PTI98_005334 [Pleurotus ostreatus]
MKYQSLSIRVKEYLKLQDRPLWTYFADRILAQNAWKSDENVPVNMFLQNWRAKLSGASESCPKELQSMVSTALKYGTRIEASLRKYIQRQLRYKLFATV